MQKNNYPTTPIVNKGNLPDLFKLPDGSRIQSAADWPKAAAYWRDLVIKMEYGGLPPAPEEVEVETLCHARVNRWEGAPRLWTYRIHVRNGARPFSFCVRILYPDVEGEVPAIINGDGCWWYMTEEIAQEIIAQGCALVTFNRTEMAEDLGYSGVPDKHKRAGGLYDVFPDHKEFGALSAWAWGYHRVVDLLYQLPYIDKKKIAVSGHSRGGKTTLIAGATDERITLVNDNGSCAGGSALYRYVGHGGETIDILNAFPSWFGKGLRPYIGKEEEIPFDQHCLLAAIAPRLLLMTYALDDRWSNPEGMVLCTEEARKAYSLLSAKSSIAYNLREGGHTHAPEDWKALLDFIGWKWQGHEPKHAFNEHPYEGLSSRFQVASSRS